jgi:hypothetical protein
MDVPVDGTFDATVGNAMEIVTSAFDTSSSTWSTPALLTNNASLDALPQLARDPSGDVLAVWHENDYGLLGGDASHPDRIMSARYANGSWTAPAVAVDDIPGLTDLGAGCGNGTATLAYTQPLTATGALTPTLQLLTSTWNGSAWSAPAQVTDDTLGNRTPQVVYTSGDQPVVAWMAGTTLRLRNLATDTQADLALPPEVGTVDEFQVVQDGAGNISAVFTAQGSQRDLYVARYDSAHAAWGEPLNLTNNPAREAYPTAGLDNAGRLLVAYASTAVTLISTTVTSSTGVPVTVSVPTQGETDLVTLAHTFGANLSLADADLALSEAEPAAGDTIAISATVHNTGDVPLDGVAVGFYDGDPASGGTLLGTVPLSTTLVAGTAATVAVPYVVPTTGGPHTIYAVADPSDAIAEVTKADNTGKLTAFGPDLVVSSASVDYWGGSEVGLQAVIDNQGADAPASTLAFYTGSITGTALVTATVPPLSDGLSTTVTVPWDDGALPAGSTTVVAAVNQSDFPQLDQSNNSQAFTVQVGSELQVSPYYLSAAYGLDGSLGITATVFNTGSTPSTAVPIVVYADTPYSGSTEVAQGTLPVISAGGSATYTAQVGVLPAGPHTLYVAVDPGQTGQEISDANNLASVVTPDEFTLPIAAGWNLLTLPLTPTTPLSASALLAGLLAQTGGSYAEIDGFTSGQWSPSYFQEVRPTPLTGGGDYALALGQGYALYSDQSGTITITGLPAAAQSVSLARGWNLVGFPDAYGSANPAMASAIVSGLLGQTGGNYAELDGFSEGEWAPSYFEEVSPSVSSPSDYSVALGQGYALYTDVAGTLAGTS